jgi:plastocyanin
MAAARPAAGAIEGKVTVRERPARRAPSRYPSGGGGAARPVQRIPAVVYLEGSLPGAARAGANEMAQQDTAFAPAVLVVRPGTEVSFPNRDGFFHNVFSYSSTQRFDLGRYPRGEAKTVRFDETGAVKIYCEVHESMRAAVIVTENPFYAVLGPEGTFRLEGVPAGVHRLVVWHVDLGTETQEVRVPDGGTARVEITIG